MDGPDYATTDLAAAEKLILQWDPSAFPSDDRSIFGGADDRADEMRLSIKDSPRNSPSSSSPIQIARARLEDEFRHILVSRVNDFEIDSLVDLNSLSLSSSMSEDLTADLSDADDDSFHRQEIEGSSHSSTNYRITSSIHEIDLAPSNVIHDLRTIADRMISSGYARELVQVYSSARKSAVDLSFRRLGIEKLSLDDVHRLDWDALVSKIRRWIRAARICVRIVFASERRLSNLIFDGLTDDDYPFVETVKGAAIQLFGFAEAISIGRRSPEKLFKILDLHDALSDLLHDLAAIFRSNSSESIYNQAADIVTRLADAVTGILSEFENAVLREPSKVPVPGGTLHPLTRYVMNYISLISDYKQTLKNLILLRPSEVTGQFSGREDPVVSPMLDFPEPENQSPLASHLIWIIVILQFNLENKANLYKDAALSHLFLMNNIHYIVDKVKGSPELRELIGDDYLRRMTGKTRQLATSYQRATWVKILYCLRDEGIHASGSFSSGVSKSTLRERFKAFNSAFDEVHRMQSTWLVPDSQLREELRISISEKLLPAYRSFLGRFQHHIESGRHPEMYIKYSAEDLETALSDFFEGSPPSLRSRRKSH